MTEGSCISLGKKYIRDIKDEERKKRRQSRKGLKRYQGARKPHGNKNVQAT